METFTDKKEDMEPTITSPQVMNDHVTCWNKEFNVIYERLNILEKVFCFVDFDDINHQVENLRLATSPRERPTAKTMQPEIEPSPIKDAAASPFISVCTTRLDEAFQNAVDTHHATVDDELSLKSTLPEKDQLFVDVVTERFAQMMDKRIKDD